MIQWIAVIKMNYAAKIDFHSHILTPAYYEYLKKYEDPRPDDFDTPVWSPGGHLKLMDRLGVTFSALSVSSPNLSRAPSGDRAEYARRINEEALAFVNEHPKRLGLFAILPLPDVEPAVQMAEHYLTADGVDGIGMTTNYGGVYLGDPRLDPLMHVLDSAGAVVCVHPTKPAGLPDDVNRGLPIPVMEFLMDTTRAFTSLVWNECFDRFPHIKWIFPHAASFIPTLSDRFDSFSILLKAQNPGKKLDFFHAMRHCYFDLAGFSLPKQIADMKQNIPVENFLYGSDCPYTPDAACIALAGNLAVTPLLTDEEKRKMFTLNAVQLIPRLRKILQIQPQIPDAVTRSQISRPRQIFSGVLDQAIGGCYNLILRLKRI